MTLLYLFCQKYIVLTCTYLFIAFEALFEGHFSSWDYRVTYPDKKSLKI